MPSFAPQVHLDAPPPPRHPERFGLPIAEMPVGSMFYVPVDFWGRGEKNTRTNLRDRVRYFRDHKCPGAKFSIRKGQVDGYPVFHVYRLA